MDIVLALTIEWKDKRLAWNQYAWGYLLNLPVKTVTVLSDEIWTPRSRLCIENYFSRS